MALKGRATEKQKDFLLELGYTGDVEALSKAQASLIIDKLVQQRDEREVKRSAAARGSLGGTLLLACLVLAGAGGGYLWWNGMLPWKIEFAAPPVAGPPPEASPELAPPVKERVEHPPPAEIADANQSPEPSPADVQPEPTPDAPPAAPVEPPPADPRVRVFEDQTGKFRVVARLKSYANGVATLVKDDGTEIKVPLNKLSDDSAQWIRDIFGLPKQAGGDR